MATTEKEIKFILTTRAKNLLQPNKIIKDKIATACGISSWTVHRWIMEDDPRITQANAMKVIREQTGLTDDLILREVEG